MKIHNINSQLAFTGNVYTFRLPVSDLCKVERHSNKILEFAKDKSFDYVLFKNGEQNGVSVLAKNLAVAKRRVYEVFGYPSGNETKDINLIIKTMNIATEELSLVENLELNNI